MAFQTLFFGPAQSGFTATYTYSLDEQSQHLAHILDNARQQGATRIKLPRRPSKSGYNSLKARLTADFHKYVPGLLQQ